MYLSEVRVEVSLEKEEISEIAYSIMRALTQSVEEHYIKWPMDTFDKQSKIKLRLAKQFFGVLGLDHAYQDSLQQMRKRIEESQ